MRACLGLVRARIYFNKRTRVGPRSCERASTICQSTSTMCALIHWDPTSRDLCTLRQYTKRGAFVATSPAWRHARRRCLFQLQRANCTPSRALSSSHNYILWWSTRMTSPIKSPRIRLNTLDFFLDDPWLFSSYLLSLNCELSLIHFMHSVRYHIYFCLIWSWNLMVWVNSNKELQLQIDYKKDPTGKKWTRVLVGD